jgi:glyoxylase-like metal-dependent hydrolase (beta-lactamase superfamily II)
MPDVHLMDGLRGCNVYLLTSTEGLTLVDAGLAGDADRIVAQLQEAGHAPSELHTIVLTHGHGDHIGGAAALARRSGARILAHRDDVPIIERTQSLPFRSLVQRLMFAFADRVLFRVSPCPVDRPLDDGEVIEPLGGMHVIHTPGHTPGSISLYQPERRILFCGDALFNANPVTGRPRLQLPSPSVSVDSAQARQSVRKLSELPVDVLCPGHGEPILDGAGEQIRALLGAVRGIAE